MYFSTKILAPVFQGDSKLIALTVMAVGIPFNFVPSVLPAVSCSDGCTRLPADVQSVSSKRLLLVSSFGTSLTALLLGIGLNAHNRALSATSVFAFALVFSIGLAPIPWVVLPEVVPPEARTAGGAVAVSVNWLTNFAAASCTTTYRRVELTSRERCSSHCNRRSSMAHKAKAMSSSCLQLLPRWPS